jgi:hypothetical protein
MIPLPQGGAGMARDRPYRHEEGFGEPVVAQKVLRRDPLSGQRRLCYQPTSLPVKADTN